MMNPMNLIQMLKGGNPTQMLMGMLRQQSGNNPVMQNALNMAEKGDSKGIENLARNLCKEQGVNPDEMFNNIKNQFAMK